MNRIHTLSLALVALLSAALVPACVAEPGDAEDGDDAREEVGTAEQAVGTSYTLGSTRSYVELADGLPVGVASVLDCAAFPNAVVRSWQLREKNLHDFRVSREWCRDMQSDGTLGADNDPMEHFYQAGDGTLGMSYPAGSVMTGIGVRDGVVNGESREIEGVGISCRPLVAQ